MATVFDEITEHHREWIAKQSMFFVATAPLSGEGKVNVSPKGPIGSLAILGPLRVAYLDAHGSGAETIAHLRENGRICVMLCAFDGPPRILRFHGTGEAILNDDPRYEELYGSADFADISIPESRRSIVVVDVERVSDSCGYGVPLMSMEGYRDHHALSSAKRLRTMGSAEAVEDFRRERGAESLDGLPSLPPRRT